MVLEEQSDMQPDSAGLLYVKLEQLRPTQCACGWQEVAQKEKEMVQKSKDASWEGYLRKKSIPVVAAPNGKMYLVDRHHMALALLHLSDTWEWQGEKKGSNPYEHCYVRIVSDVRKQALDKERFYQYMESKGMLYPFDQNGQRVSIRAIPYSIGDLQDDPFRALAGFARKAGAYKKMPIAYAEFAWAQYYRGLLSKTMVQTNMGKALQLAMMLSADQAAAHLPGYSAVSEAQSMALQKVLESLQG